MQAIFFSYSIHNGKYNMDFDEKMLNYAIEQQLTAPILRFYGWSPACVSLGRNQNDKHINKTFCTAQGIDFVRRLTGGRALLHDNELTYSFVCPCNFLENGETIIKSYKEISGALAAGLKKVGIEAEFPIEKKSDTKFEYCMSLATGADLSCRGKKIVGSAQFRKQGYILQHGSIIFDYNPDIIEKIFSEKPEINHIATIKNLMPSLTVEDLCKALKIGYEEYFDIEFTKTLTAL